MASLLERSLIVVTGKGGSGKSTIAGALGLLGAQQGLRTIVVEMGRQSHLATLYGHAVESNRAGDPAAGGPALGVETELEPGLYSLSLDPDRALVEWVRKLGGGLPARLLASSSSFRYFAAAAPGAEELVSLVKLHDLSTGGGGRYELVVLDAPATGHALAMLASPSTFAAIVRGGPLAQRAGEVREMLSDASFSAYVAVARATEMAVSETIDLARGLHERTGRTVDTAVINGTISRRFSLAELELIETLAKGSTHGRERRASEVAVAVARAAHSTRERTQTQRRQIARLRRELGAQNAPPVVLTVPFAFVPQLNSDNLREIAAHLAAKLG